MCGCIHPSRAHRAQGPHFQFLLPHTPADDLERGIILQPWASRIGSSIRGPEPPLPCVGGAVDRDIRQVRRVPARGRRCSEEERCPDGGRASAQRHPRQRPPPRAPCQPHPWQALRGPVWRARGEAPVRGRVSPLGRRPAGAEAAPADSGAGGWGGGAALRLPVRFLFYEPFVP